MTEHLAVDPALAEILVRTLPLLTEAAALRPDADLSALGLDSMHAVDLLFEIEDTFGVILADWQLETDTFSTPRALWAAIVGAGVQA